MLVKYNTNISILLGIVIFYKIRDKESNFSCGSIHTKRA